ncbi:MAG: hypothetical protein R3236_10295, partial [Phycisphaeraceae bacterium]|nr:hypothetical protein [Phycisphaeraceae bacterium]
MIEGLFDSGAMPVLERVVQFTSRRHDIIAHNIANADVPNFVPANVPVETFQQALGDALDRRENAGGTFGGSFRMQGRPGLRVRESGLDLVPQRLNDNLLFHDRGNRSLEDQMKALAENAMAHNTALSMIRNQMDLLETAIRER